jgi:hypothetical protein
MKYRIIAKNSVTVEYENIAFLSLPVPKVFKFPSLSINHDGFLKNNIKHINIYTINKY